MAIRPAAAEALRVAMTRLWAGTPQHCDGKLTWNNVCREAGVARATAARAGDLIAEWKNALAEPACSGSVPTHLEKMRERRDRREAKVRTASEILDELRDTIHILANHIQALSLALERKEAQVARLQGELARPRSHHVVSLRK